MKPIRSLNYRRRYKEKVSYVKWRFFVLCMSIGLALISLIIRITYLQVINPEDFVREGDMRSLRVKKVPAIRGMINDRYERQLAVSVPVYAIWADPKIIYKNGVLTNDERWQKLANELKISLEKIKSKISINHNSRFVYLARQVNPSIGEYINKLKIPGFYLLKEFRRYYPSGPATAHLIGVTNIDGQGIEGIEKSFNYMLTGSPGERVVRKDRYGNIVEDISFIDRKVAHNLILSIDEHIQSLAYNELTSSVIKNKAKSGTAILIDVNTGEVLAMTNSPSYNPNKFSNTSAEVMRNRAITDVFEPASTVKPIIIITALNNGIVKTNSVLNTQPFMINGHEIKDVARYNKLSISGILQKSSNVGISKLALAMPATELIDAYSNFGFGKSTNLGLIGENIGIFPNKKMRLSKFERAALSFGYGLMITPLQLARAYATIGSFGIYRPLSIRKVDTPVLGIRIFPDEIIRKVVSMMESFILPTNSVLTEQKGYKVAIKTGTAKKVGKDGHYVKQYVSYTAGVAPASKPRYALIVIINEPTAGKYYGSVVSTPVFKKIMGEVLYLMNIKHAESLSNNSELIINKVKENIDGKS
ncbi:MAG: peptidoglycan glycosyltransferase FtsI [Arsenophonus sp.]